MEIAESIQNDVDNVLQQIIPKLNVELDLECSSLEISTMTIMCNTSAKSINVQHIYETHKVNL